MNKNLFYNRTLLCLIIGVVWAFAFPGFNISGVAWLIPGAIFLLSVGTSDGSAFKYGFITGLSHYLISLHWLLYIPVKLAPIAGWIALCAYLALYPALLCLLSNRLNRLFNLTRLNDLATLKFSTVALIPFLFAAIWVTLELIRGRLLTGFPWNFLGTSQFQMLPLIQISSYTGVYGVSFMICWFSVGLAISAIKLIHNPIPRVNWIKPILLPVLGIVLAVIYGSGVMFSWKNEFNRGDVKIALIQPSIPQTMIWDSSENSNRFEKLIQLANTALLTKPDILVFPEAAIPELFRYHYPTYKTIIDIATNYGVWMIIGADDAEQSSTITNQVLYYNSSFLISPQGTIEGQYSKQHLVIFGEYVPLSRWLPFLKHLTPIGDSSFTPGKGPVKFRLFIKKQYELIPVTTSVIICFEDVIPHLVRRHITADIDFLMNLTNDGWFGESSAQWQHAANAVFRAIENRVPLVRCTNNGLTCWVDPAGGIHAIFFDNSTDIYSAGFKTAVVPLKNSGVKQSFYSLYGDLFGYFCGIITLFTCIVMYRRRIYCAGANLPQTQR